MPKSTIHPHAHGPAEFNGGDVLTNHLLGFWYVVANFPRGRCTARARLGVSQ
jgi:hypothetical protein